MSFDGNLIEKVCEVFRSLVGMRKGLTWHCKEEGKERNIWC